MMASQDHVVDPVLRKYQHETLGGPTSAAFKTLKHEGKGGETAGTTDDLKSNAHEVRDQILLSQRLPILTHPCQEVSRMVIKHKKWR